MHWKNVRVLITGASGFIGSSLARKLVILEADVTILDNVSYGKRENIPAECKLVIGNVNDPASFQKLTGEFDYIFHLAAPSSVILFNRDPITCFNDTVDGLINAIKFAREKKVKKLVFPSSGSVYGEAKSPQAENVQVKPVNIYGIAKYACEHIARINKDVKSVALRIFAGYGPGEDHKNEFASPVTLFLTSILKDESPVIFGDGTQSRDFVYIDDVVDAFLSAAQSDAEGVVNVGSGEAYSFNEVVALINKKLGKNIKPSYVHKPINYLENTKADITVSRAKLKMNYLSLDEGLTRYLSTLKK